MHTSICSTNADSAFTMMIKCFLGKYIYLSKKVVSVKKNIKSIQVVPGQVKSRDSGGQISEV